MCLQFEDAVYELAVAGKKLWLSPSGTSYGVYQKILEGAEESLDPSRGKRRRMEHGYSPGQARVHEAANPIQLAKAVKVCPSLHRSVRYAFLFTWCRSVTPVNARFLRYQSEKVSPHIATFSLCAAVSWCRSDICAGVAPCD